MLLFSIRVKTDLLGVEVDLPELDGPQELTPVAVPGLVLKRIGVFTRKTMYCYRREGIPSSSLIEATFALKSQKP